MEKLADRNEVWLVGAGYAHHAAHSGYEGFGSYVGRSVAPFGFRWLRGPVGWILNRLVSCLTGHQWYSIGALLTELIVLKLMYTHKNSIYHFLYGDSDIWLLRFRSRKRSSKLIASFHQPPNDLEKIKVLATVALSLDAIVLVSEYQRAYFDGIGIGQKVFVVLHGVDTNIFRPSTAPAQGPTRCIVLGSHLRDFRTLVAAVQRVWTVDPSIHFTIIGANPRKHRDLRDLQDDRVLFLQGLSETSLVQALQAGRLAVFPLLDATANNAMLEAMAVGLPVIATNVGGVAEYLPSEGSVLVPRCDSEAMAGAILRLTANLQEADDMGRRCRERAEQLSFPKTAARMRAVYDEISSQE